MKENVLQCCYSNLTDSTGASGWQTAAVSPGVPAQVVKKYARMQDANIAVSASPVDAAGNARNLFEIQADGIFVYMTRIQYGLADVRGRRNNMFSHTYLFPVTDELLENPNAYLTVEDSNFTGDYETAKNIRTSFERCAPWTLDSARKAAGLTETNYRALVLCMYEQREQKKTLYIKTTRGEGVIRPVLYALLVSLPLAMRREFSAASALVQETSLKNLVFQDPPRASDFFFDLDTGKTNVLTDRIKKKYARWGYADFFSSNTEAVDSSAYFRALEDMAHKLGDAKAEKPRVLRLAFQLLTAESSGELDYAQARERLYDVLTATAADTEFLEKYVVSLLRVINAEGQPLDELVDQELTARLARPAGKALQEEGLHYQVTKIRSLDLPAGARALQEMDREQFSAVSRKLLAIDGGSAYLDEYFTLVLPSAPVTWSSLEADMNRIDDCCGENAPKAIGLLNEAARAFYETQLGGRDPVSSYTKYVDFRSMTATFEAGNTAFEESGSGGRGGAPEPIYVREAKELFWNRWKITGYDPDRTAVPENLYLAGNRNSILCSYLADGFEKIRQGKTRAAENSFLKLFKEYGGEMTREERKEVYRLAREYFTARDFEVPTHIKNDLYLMAELGSDSYTTDYVRWSGQIERQQEAEFIRDYDSKMQGFKTSRMKETFFEVYTNLFLIQIHKLGILNNLSIDMCLVIGKWVCENPFQILDILARQKALPKKLKELPPERIVEESELLFEGDYLTWAEDYLETELLGCDLVSRWLEEWKAAQRGPGLSGLTAKIRGGADSMFGRKRNPKKRR